jgi:hypothetical protein
VPYYGSSRRQRAQKVFSLPAECELEDSHREYQRLLEMPPSSWERRAEMMIGSDLDPSTGEPLKEVSA